MRSNSARRGATRRVSTPADFSGIPRWVRLTRKPGLVLYREITRKAGRRPRRANCPPSGIAYIERVIMNHPAGQPGKCREKRRAMRSVRPSYLARISLLDGRILSICPLPMHDSIPANSTPPLPRSLEETAFGGSQGTKTNWTRWRIAWQLRRSRSGGGASTYFESCRIARWMDRSLASYYDKQSRGTWYDDSNNRF